MPIMVYHWAPKDPASPVSGFDIRPDQVEAIHKGRNDRLKYRLVALVEGSDLEEAFKLTNSIEDGWWKNEGVKPLFSDEGCRSSSPGDLFVDYDADKRYLVMGCGFKEV